MEENEPLEESPAPLGQATTTAGQAEALVEAEQAVRKPRSNTHCLNCGAELHDVFCHHCGQKDIPRRQTLGELFTNFISSFWSYEGKFFLTTRHLLLKPGFLATEYNAGRRERYYHPARMYVFISFVFFLVFSSFSDDAAVNMAQLDPEDVAELRADFPSVKIDSLLLARGKKTETGDTEVPTAWLDSLRSANGQSAKPVSLTTLEHKTFAAYDSAQQRLPEDKRDNWIIRKLTERNYELNNRYKRSADFGKDFLKALDENFSKILFVLLPIFALLLKLLYARSDYFYSEHLVFSIYFYNFAYLIFSLQVLVGEVPWLAWMGQLLGLWVLVYLAVALKRAYQQSWRKTLTKWAIFLFLFLLAITLVFVLWGLFIVFTL